jgi:DNA-binding MarR family transcriptional regulator
MGRAPRITNRERILLALEDAHEYETRYEIPRRFGQRGLAQRLEMAQSHVSRAINGLLEEDLVIAGRRRVAGEKRRVNAYSLTERGVDRLSDLIAALNDTTVLISGVDGTLEQHPLRSIAADLANNYGSIDSLGMADLLRDAEIHDGMPLLSSATLPAGLGSGGMAVGFDGNFSDSDVESDLSAEAIGLHLELVEMHVAAGRAGQAIEHLERAARLHRLRGSSEGEARCLLATAAMGATIDSEALSSGLEAVADSVVRIRLSIELHQHWAAQGVEDADAAARWIIPQLRDVWNGGHCSEQMPLVGHIGFTLSSLVEPDEAEAILIILLRLFEADGDTHGIEVCRNRLNNLNPI